jgi:glycosyltransferase involved in cell wall biosynthesis
VLIPAYEPPAELLRTVDELLRLGFLHIVVVDDGSSSAAQSVFRQLLTQHPGVHLLRHAVNLGKGAALKSGLNHILIQFPEAPGAVTADADGQHLASDILRVASALADACGHSLTLGARRFDRDVPRRSLLGNRISAAVMRVLVGEKLSDTQTGLRGIPATLARHILRLPPNGYEFELDVLIACKHRGVPIIEIPIETVYLDNNRSSHFNPLWDSMRIYFVFLRFTLASLITALIDNTVFIALHGTWGNIAGPQLAARAAALMFNYAAGRSAVFQSRDRHRDTLPRFLALAAAHITLSYGMITFLHLYTGMKVIIAKVSVEAVLFLANFAIQRDFVFTRKREAA